MSPTVNKIRLLMVEDDLANQFGIMSILEHSGYKVDLANNGQEALNMLEVNEYALVLIDCSMPVMNGYDTTSTIRDQTSKVRNRTIPIIALTAYAMPEDRDKCIAAGMNDYLSKPVMIPDLLEKIEKWTSINHLSLIPNKINPPTLVGKNSDRAVGASN